MSEGFEQFAIVELFGHNIIAGKVSEQVIGGQGFVRVDVPAVDGREAFTKFYGAGAIYAITPTDEPTMTAAVQGLQQKPIETYKLNLPQLQVPVRESNDFGSFDPERDTEDFEDKE